MFPLARNGEVTLLQETTILGFDTMLEGFIGGQGGGRGENGDERSYFLEEIQKMPQAETQCINVTLTMF